MAPRVEPATRGRPAVVAPSISRRRPFNWLSAALVRARASSLAVIVLNAGSLVSTYLSAAALGAVYWGLAARYFSPADVGLASAAVSASSLLGAVSLMGTGTLLIGELPPRQTYARIQLITTAVAVTGLIGVVLGAVFGLAAPLVSPEFREFGNIFVLGLTSAVTVGLTAASTVVDHASIALLRGGMQTARNVLFACAKLGALGLAAVLTGGHDALQIYITWPVGIIVSLAVVASIVASARFPLAAYRPDWRWLRHLGRLSALHHTLNIASQTPGLVLPFMVTILLSASDNAYFYIAYMLANFIFMVPNALSTALYAIGSHDPGRFAHTLRLTLGLSLLGAVGANIMFLIAAGPLLSLIARNYADAVVPLLHVLAIGAFPIIIRTHYVAICQAFRRLRTAIITISVGAAIELAGAAVGAHFGRLEGLSVGWMFSLWIEAVLMGPMVFRAATPRLSLTVS